MENNSNVATPVNVMNGGGGPPLPVDATIVAPLPLPVTPAPLPAGAVPDGLPVTPWSPYTAAAYAGFNSSCPEDGNVIVPVGPAQVRSITGYCRDPDPAALYWVQLFDLAAVPIAPGALPLVFFPLRGGYQAFSYLQPALFNTGICIALSTTEDTFTPPVAPNLYTFNAIVGIVPP